MLESLQILRAIAAAMVALTHFWVINVSGSGWSPVEFGAAGVDVFFVISGFIMVHSSARLFGRAGAPRTFVVSRLARIVPLYWSVTLLGYVLYHLWYGGAQSSIAAIVCSFAFIPCGTDHGIPLYGVGWTLNFEMFFYVLFAGCLLLHRRSAVITISCMLLLFVAVGAFAQMPLPLGYWFDPIILEFALGALLALAYAEGLRLPKRLCLALIVCGVIGCAATIWWWQGYVPSPWDRRSPPRPVALGIPALLVVAGAVLGDTPGKRHGTITMAMAYLGNASYSIYLLHPLITFVVQAFNLRLDNKYLGVVADFCILFPLSLATYRWFERPTQRMVKYLFAGRQKQAVESSQSPASSRRRLGLGYLPEWSVANSRDDKQDGGRGEIRTHEGA